eukprot:CAMPEP_0119465102 /NCGR_PEP_ID=MMETSP1344-20130328/386_1 /TAXON_ID=236787 /ORGANISM="Florenciella parvula, Strain CCMP2471" /LENGTH=701 /DNA_ID=CAMNT_0007497343 /DNA_START=366 /DNA_END=2470 /DNA_ORIENTATION=+
MAMAIAKAKHDEVLEVIPLDEETGAEDEGETGKEATLTTLPGAEGPTGKRPTDKGTNGRSSEGADKGIESTDGSTTAVAEAEDQVASLPRRASSQAWSEHRADLNVEGVGSPDSSSRRRSSVRMALSGRLEEIASTMPEGSFGHTVALGTMAVVERAFDFTAHSIRHTFLIAVVGVLLGEVPLSMLAEAIGESITGNPLQPHNVTGVNGTVLQRYPRSTARIQAEHWSDPDFESAAGDVVATQIHFGIWHSFINTMLLNVGMFLSAMAMYGWDKVKGRVLTLAVLGQFLILASHIPQYYFYAMNDSANPLLHVLDVLFYTFMVVINLHRFMAPSVHGWRKTLGPMVAVLSVFIAGEEVLNSFAMPFYFSSDNQVVRLVIRSMFLPGFKYCLIHVILVAGEALDVPNKDSIYQALIVPLTMVTVAGHSMQLGSADLQEAVIMEALLCFMEVFEYFTYLRGETHVTKGLKKIWWLHKQTGGSLGRRGAARITQSPGGALEAAAKAMEEQKRLKARRVRLLTNVAVSLGMVEGISSTMTSAMFLITRINPGVVGGEPLDTMYVAKLWAIQMLFELILPEIVLAILSQKWAKQGEFGDMTQALRRTSTMQNMLITGFTAVATASYMHMYFIEALCPAPRDVDGGGGAALVRAVLLEARRLGGRIVRGVLLDGPALPRRVQRGGASDRGVAVGSRVCTGRIASAAV